MDATETARIYAFCCTTWRQRPSEAELAAWKLVLADTEFEPGMAAAVALARTGREFMPAPGALIAKAEGSRQPDHAIAIGEARFLPGSGWLGGRLPENGRLSELDAPADSDNAVRSIRSARSALRRHDSEGDR
jgi:hypothetical protein